MEETRREVESVINEESGEPLSKLPNIGKVLEEQLRQAGITNTELLRKMGSQQAWLKIRRTTAQFAFTASMHWRGRCRESRRHCWRRRKKEELREFFQSVTRES